MTLRVLTIGAGYFAPFQLEAWQALGVALVGLCDTDAERARTLAQRFGIAHTATDSAALLDQLQPDLVDIVTPPWAHAALVQLCQQRGIAAICQKPFGADWAQAQAMAQAATQSGVMLAIHENFRFTPWFRECRRLLDTGFLGDVHALSFRLRPGDGQGPQAYLDRQPAFQRMPRFLVRETAIHFIDTFRYLLGEVRAVSAVLRQINPHIAGEDAGLIVLEMERGCSALFDGNRLNDHSATNPRRTMGEMWLEGTHGVLRLDGDARLWWKPHHQTERAWAYDHGDDTAFGGACRALQAHVLRHLQDGTALENSAQDYLQNLRIQEAIYQAHATGQRVVLSSFDPDSPPH